MNKYNIFLIFLVLFISMSAVSAEGSLSELEMEIDKSTDTFEITQDYAYSQTDDGNYTKGVYVNKTNFVINGNGHTIDGQNESRLFRVDGTNVTVNDLVIINGNAEYGGGILSLGKNIIFNNITFKNDYASNRGGGLAAVKTVTINNSTFIDNAAPEGNAIYGEGTIINIEGSYFESTNTLQKAMVYGYLSAISINNSIFANSTSKSATAIYNDRKTYITNSQFINLNATMSAGAIAIKELDEVFIENCSFINVTSSKNAGAVSIDTAGFLYNNTGISLIKNCEFLNCSSEFGGALIILGGNGIILQSTFKDNRAVYDGGAIYLSNGKYIIGNTLIENNKLTYAEKELVHGGGIYVDRSILTAYNSHFIDNAKHGLYSYDSDLNITGSLFKNNGEAIHGVFLETYYLNNTYINNTNCLNDTNYKSIVAEKVKQLDLLNDTIIFSKLPKKFDLRDWGWVSSVKNQNTMNACWSFGPAAAMESALIKYTGIEYDFSENNIQNSMLKYSKFGDKDMQEGGGDTQVITYAINWFGMLNEFDDEFDDIGKISQFISSPENVHIQDVVIINPRKNLTDNNAIKEAVLKYCGLSVGIHSELEAPYYNKNTSAQYFFKTGRPNHTVFLVGWDDAYSAKNFLVTPPGDGAWIIKNSYGTEHGDQGYDYISYYDTGFATSDVSTGYIFENNEPYNKNYQTDLGGTIKYYESDKGINVSYKNSYTALDDDLIAAVGTYFFENGEKYNFKIYVNNELKLSQNGTAPFKGYHTIKLDKNIPIEENDNFTVVMTKKYVPILEDSRQHFENNTSFADFGRGFYDLGPKDETVSLKIYTIDAAILTEDLVKIYKNESQFKANIGVANQTVTFEINGGKYERTSDAKGIATMNINLIPGNYKIKTTFNGTSVENNIKVLPTLIGDDLVKYYRNESQFFIKLIDGKGNPVAGQTIKMNINGVFYDRVTDENGIAKLNINLNPGEYILTAIDPLTGLQMSYTITVLPVLTGEDLNMVYKDGSKFSATLVDSKGNPRSGVNITFNINGVFYNRATDKNGIARLNINLMPGEYIITSQYGSSMTSNKITIAAKEE
ncbi:C1 family peptidase [uncultured Methanobrevibacter sp.]|uniref:C1 family peptidase n=1 Tax=uncultured Methanobrevibacter sp. TaxID=253161 RepID=UPI0025FF8DA4|nr:C1 family peptidase [uncultured Methanobrevibacter sp.]